MKTNTFLALLLAAVVTWGCGSDTKSTPAAAPSAQKTGTVTFSVKFPAAGASRAFIDQNTTSITIDGQGYMGGWYLPTPVVLTPASPTATIEVPEGQLCFSAQAKDTNGNIFDNARTCGEIVATINNKATLTFLGGDWQFVNASGTPTPLTLSSATHGDVSLAGFRLSGNQYTGPAKTAIDYTKPSGWSDYKLQYFSGTTTNALTFAPAGFGGSESQFLPGATASTNYHAFWGGTLNLDTPANSPMDNISFNWSTGERIAFILDEVSGSNTTETITTSTGGDGKLALEPYATSQVADASTITGHYLEMTYGPTPTKVEKTVNTDCNLFWRQFNAASARAAAIKAALAGRAGKAAPGDPATTLDAGTITVVYDDCETNYAAAQVDGDGDGDMANDWLSYDANNNGRYDAADGDTYVDYNADSNFDFTYYPGTIYTITESYSNVVARAFRAKATQKGTGFVLPPATITSNNAYVEYRTFETGSNRYTAWVEYKDGTALVNQTDFSGVKLVDPSGAGMQSTALFQKFSYTTGTWNGSSFGTSIAAGGHSGFYFDLGSYTSLATGTYTFKANLATGQTIDTPVTVGNLPSLPVVSSATMSATWNTDNSLTLSWTEPVGTFGNYRIVIIKPLATGNAPIFFGKANPGTSSITLSTTDLAQIALASGVTDTTQLLWQVQTRSYDASNIEIARGTSNVKSFGASGTGIIVR